MSGEKPISALSTAIRARCPRCGKAPLFRYFLHLRPVCEACALDYREFDPGDGPAVFGIMIVGALAAILAVVIEIRYAAPIWANLTVVVPFIIVASLIVLRLFKGWLIGREYRHQAAEGRIDSDISGE